MASRSTGCHGAGGFGMINQADWNSVGEPGSKVLQLWDTGVLLGINFGLFLVNVVKDNGV